MSIHLIGVASGIMLCCGRSIGAVRQLEGRDTGLWTSDPASCTCPSYRPPSPERNTTMQITITIDIPANDPEAAAVVAYRAGQFSASLEKLDDVTVHMTAVADK